MSSSSKESATKKEQKKEIKPPAFIEAESLNDIARLACALERAPLPIFAIHNEGKNMIATEFDFFLGRHVFYFVYSDQSKHFLGYKTTQTGEEVSFVDAPTNPSLIHSPIIDIVKLPEVFYTGLKEIGSTPRKGVETQKFLSLEVKDLVSLVKVASYKILFEEPPLPIFAFPSEKKGKWCLGSFTRMEDYEEASIFFYCEQESRPDFNFVRYSMTKADATLTNRTDEHGYVYIKIVRLKHPHPLVQAE